MNIDILTIFPEIFNSPFSSSIIQKARDKNLIKINAHNLRDWSCDSNKTVDDYVYGGGPGMLFRPEPLIKAINYLKNDKYSNEKVIYLTTTCNKFDKKLAK